MNGWTETARTFGIILGELLILFILVSFLLTLIQRFAGPDRIQRWLGGSRLIGILKGIGLGALTPFCSCSTLPLFVGFLRAGVPFATAVAFLIASPLLNPIIIGAVILLFGLNVAIGYAVVAFICTFLIAVAWDMLGFDRFVKRVRVVGGSDPYAGPWRGLRIESGAAWRESLSTLRPLLIPMLVGVSVGAMIYGAVPEDLLVRVAGPEEVLAVPIAALAGIPLYVRTESALPIGLALVTKGMGIGPVFALIIGGAGASIPEVSMLSAIFKPQLLVAFVGSILAVAIAGGIMVPAF